MSLMEIEDVRRVIEALGVKIVRTWRDNYGRVHFDVIVVEREHG